MSYENDAIRRAMIDAERRQSDPHRRSGFRDGDDQTEKTAWATNLLAGLPGKPKQSIDAPAKHSGKSIVLGGAPAAQKRPSVPERVKEIEKEIEAASGPQDEPHDLLDDLLGISPSKPSPAKPVTIEEDDDDPFKILAG